MSVLDDLKMIHERDAQDALGVAQKQWQQLIHDYPVSYQPSVDGIQNIVVAGMGGSALAAEYVKAWARTTKPFEIVRNYDLPHYVNAQTLIIASSYSGNTEETISALAAAEEKGCQIVVVCAGGRLKEVATDKGYPLFVLPGNFQPRMAVFYNLAALLQILEPAACVSQGSIKELHEAAQWLKTEIDAWRPDVPTANNAAKKLALELMGSSPVIYGSVLTFPVAYKWKISFNENAKNVAWCNQYPEFNHNEFLGWSSHPVDKPYKIIDLRSSFDHERVSKRFELSARMLSGKRAEPNTVTLSGDSELKQLLWGTAFGDFVSLYLALLNGLNPTPVDLIEKFKAELG